MMTYEPLHALLALTLASSGAIMLALVLRRPARHLLGAATSCSFWLMVPASLVAVLLPRMNTTGAVPSGPVGMRTPVSAFQSVVHFSFVAAGADSQGAWPAWVLCAWIAGAAALFFCFVAQQRVFENSLGIHAGSRRVLRTSAAGCPAVMGLLRPKLILPSDFRRRYTYLERRLILSHERAHLRRGDLAWNALAAGLRCLFWFNPLAHIAAACFRADQELACDAAVMLRHPGTRRTYAAAMLKTQLAAPTFPLGCGWNSAGALKERLRMLNQALPGRARRTCGRVCVALTCMAASYTVWASQPAEPRNVAPEPGTTNPHSAGRAGLVPSERAGSWCESWHPTLVFGGDNAAIYAEAINANGTLAKVLVVRSRAPVVEVAVAPSARRDLSKDGTLHLFTLYDGALYEGVGTEESKVMQHFEVLTVPLQPDQVHNLDVESRKELRIFMDEVMRVAQQSHVALQCP